MINILTIVTFLALTINIYRYLFIWKTRSFLHPGFYFSLLWTISVLSQWILVNLNFALLPAPEYINELHIYVLFTSVCFLCWSFIGVNYKVYMPRISLLSKESFFDALILLTLLSTITLFLLSGSSFNMADTRIGLISGRAHIGRVFSVYYSFFSIIRSFLPIVTIIAGMRIGKIVLYGKLSRSHYKLFIPLFSSILFAFSIGGRNPLLLSIKQYIVGFALVMPFVIPKYNKRKIIKYTLIILIIFILFINFVQDQRKDTLGYSGSREYTSSMLRFFSGVFEYLSAHYWGYQLRRTEMNDDLTYGTYTFYGFFDIDIPLSSMLGFDKSLADLLNIKNYRLESYDENKEGYYTTSSIFIQIIRDFGSKGAFVFIALFTLYTHFLFLNILKTRKKTALSFFTFYMCFLYWSSSNFTSVYSFKIINTTLIPFIFFDILQKIKFSSTTNSNVVSNKALKIHN